MMHRNDHRASGIRMPKRLPRWGRAATRDARLDRDVRKTRTISESLIERPCDELGRAWPDSARLAGDADMDARCTAAALVAEAIRRTTGMRLYETQIRAGLIVASGAVCEMQTGEGKTLAMAIAAAIHASAGRGVHVATPNAYLARRDATQLGPAYERLGFSCAVLPGEGPPTGDEEENPYEADITYGPGYAFGFDGLRDRFAQADPNPRSPRWRFRHRIALPPKRQRPVYAAIIDEVDHVLIDDAVSPLVLSSATTQVAEDASWYVAANAFIEQLDTPEHYVLDESGFPRWTDSGMRLAYADLPDLATRCGRPWHDYVSLALQAHHMRHRNVDYVVEDNQIRIIDESTGRIHRDRQWSDGLQQAVEAKERIAIRAQATTLARVTRQRWFAGYPVLGGTTGTAVNCEREFRDVYRLPVIAVEPRVPSRLDIWPLGVVADQAAKLTAITHQTRDLIRGGRAVLIAAPDIAAAAGIATRLRDTGLRPMVLDGTQDRREAEIVARAGGCGAVTVATGVAGRGTDIRLADEVRRRGGLHIVVVTPSLSPRLDRQLIGRAARGGDPGSCQTFLAADDNLASETAPWIGRAIRRAIDAATASDPCPSSTLAIDERLRQAITAEILRLGRRQQREATAKRWRLLRADSNTRGLKPHSEFPQAGIV